MFAAPFFLAGLLAIALPLWLHRIAKENRVRQQFSSLMLLEQSETHHTRQRRLRYFVLLALRILLLLAIVLAFAQPLVSARLAPPVRGNAFLHAIVMDTSLSMRAGDRWERAQRTARGLFDSFGARDQVMLVSAAGSRIQTVVAPGAPGDFGAVRGAIGSLEPQLARLDFGLLMSTADSWLGSRTLPVRMHFVTDAQASAAPLQFAELQAPADTQLTIHDVNDGAPAPPANAWVSAVDLAANDSRSIEVKVGGAPDASRQIVLAIDGKETARQRAVALTSFGGLEFTPGTHRVEARLDPADALPADDVRRAVIRQGNARVLLAAREVDSDDVAYFGAAIGAVTRPRLAVERADAETLDKRDLASYAAVVVSDAGGLSQAAAGRLRRHIEGGGMALVTLGARALSAGKDPVSGLVVRDGGTAPQRVSFVDESHPTLRAAQSWRGVRFFRHLKLEAAKDDQVLVSLEDGSPLLIERRVGRGRLLLFAAPLARDWNDLAIHPLFVEFVSEVARYLAAADSAAASATVGVPMATGLTAGSGGQIFDPQGRRAVTLGAAGAGTLLPGETGFYEIRGGDAARWIAVNVDVRESDLQPMTAATLQRWAALRREPEAPARNTAAAAPDEARAPRIPLGRWFVAAALLFGALEMLLANRHLGVRREVAQ